MRRRLVRLAMAVALLPAIAGCGIGESPTQDYVAIRTGFELGGPTALLNGKLIVADGCVWVASDDGGQYLPLWPRGSRAYGVPDGPPDVVEVNGHKLIAGASVSLGGGERKDVEGIEPALESPIPSACRGGPFWWVTTVGDGSGGEAALRPPPPIR